MATIEQQYNVTELDFDRIKGNLKSFFKNSSRPEYRDWDFDGSGLSTLLDVLAYNTHYNAMLAHMSINETFIDSAQVRKNVVGHAKLLGYIPHSMRAPVAKLRITVNGNSGLTLVLPRGAVFTSVIDEQTYSFVTLNSYTAEYDGAAYIFEDVLVYQGTIRTAVYTVDENVDFQKFIIPDNNADITTLRVRVKDSITSSIANTYTRYTSLVDVDGTSNIYFIQENSDGRYEISFGDGIFGSKPKSLSLVEIEFLSTVGTEANFANTFAFTGSIDGFSVTDIETVEAASSGGDRESIDSVRFNAPLAFISQNRAVTADDYKAIILREFGALDSISIWGGEKQEEPEYGKVFISVKPLNSDYLTDTDKERISAILARYNVLTLTTELVDPDYVKLYLQVDFKYNPNRTELANGELVDSARAVIAEYNDVDLQRFDGVFRHSKLLRAIDASNPAIVNSSIKAYLYKTLPDLSGAISERIHFSTALFEMKSKEFITSDVFIYNGFSCYLGDEPTDDENIRNVYIYRFSGNNRVKMVNQAGSVNIQTGSIALSNFTLSTTQTIKVRVIPNSYDVAPRRNQILQIDLSETIIVGDIDTISVGGSYGAFNYQANSRT